MLVPSLWKLYVVLCVLETGTENSGISRIMAVPNEESSFRSAKDLLKEHRSLDNALPTIPSIVSMKDKPFMYKPFILNKFQSRTIKNKTNDKNVDPYTRVVSTSSPKTTTAQDTNSNKKPSSQLQARPEPNNQNKNTQPKPTQQPGVFRPACAREVNFCLHTIDYPDDRVHEIIDSYYDDVRLIYNELHQYPPEEFITDDNVTHQFRHKGHFICESEVAYIRLGWALNWKNKWMVVINTDKYPQNVRIETCKFPNGRCEYLPPCYKSSCIQRQMPVKLLAIDPNKPHHRPIVDVFQIPTSCSCFVENYGFS